MFLYSSNRILGCNPAPDYSADSLNANTQMDVCCVFYASLNSVYASSQNCYGWLKSRASHCDVHTLFSMTLWKGSWGDWRWEMTHRAVKCEPWLLLNAPRTTLTIQETGGVSDTCRGLHGVMQTLHSWQRHEAKKSRSSHHHQRRGERFIFILKQT